MTGGAFFAYASAAQGAVARTSPGQAFFDRQVALLEAGNVEGIVTQYHDDAVIVGFDFTVRGREAIRRHFEGYLGRLGEMRVRSVDKFTEVDEGIFFEATVDTTPGEARVYDVFLLRDGRATQHFTGVTSFTPRAQIA